MAYSYDPKKVSVSIGPVLVTGWADGTFVELTPNADDWDLYTGADGTVSRSKLNNEVWNLKITVAQTSPSNDLLSALRGLDLSTGAGAFPVLVKDGSGRSLHAGLECWFKKGAGKKYGKGIEPVEWEIVLTGVEDYVGGNGRANGLLV